MDLRITIGDGKKSLSLTDIAIKKTIEGYRDTFKADPKTLPGSLADDNKAIFQRAYALEILKNPKNPDKHAAAQKAIRETPFGTKRAQNGYDKFTVTPKGEIEILVGQPPQLVRVPRNIEVIATK